jgi:hypothetical protein
MVNFHVFGGNRGNLSLYFIYFMCYFINKRNFSPYFSSIKICKSLTGAYLRIKNAWSTFLQAFFFTDLLAKLLISFGTNYYTKSNVHSYFVLQKKPGTKLCTRFHTLNIFSLQLLKTAGVHEDHLC